MEKLAVIVPYRNRQEHLKDFLFVMPRHLGDIDFHILIIEQNDNKPFNRGKLCNAGVLLLPNDFTHIVFHDVDMLPAESAVYPMDGDVIHLASSVEQFDFRMPYRGYFGGVTMFPINTFKMVNGFYNDFWGWGAEDDDLLYRCIHNKINIKRRDNNVFFSLPHPTADKTFEEQNKTKLKDNQRNKAVYLQNGLNTCGFSIAKELKPYDFCTQFLINI